MPDTDIADLRQKELLYAIERAEKEYKSYCETWDGIDRKAQATTTVAGVFLGALFAFIPQLHRHADIHVIAVILVEMVVLIVAIGASLWATSARGSSLPPCAEEQLPNVLDRMAVPNNVGALKEAQLTMYQSWAKEWVTANASVDLANHVKSRFLRIGQGALFAAAFLTVLVGAMMLISTTKSDSQPAPVGADDARTGQQFVLVSPVATQSASVPPTINITNNVSSNMPPVSQLVAHIQRRKPDGPSSQHSTCPPR
jgi:hypothetical protein